MPGYNNINRHKSWDTKRWENLKRVAKAEVKEQDELHKLAEIRYNLSNERFQQELNPTRGIEWMYSNPVGETKKEEEETLKEEEALKPGLNSVKEEGNGLKRPRESDSSDDSDSSSSGSEDSEQKAKRERKEKKRRKKEKKEKKEKKKKEKKKKEKKRELKRLEKEAFSNALRSMLGNKRPHTV